MTLKLTYQISFSNWTTTSRNLISGHLIQFICSSFIVYFPIASINFFIFFISFSLSVSFFFSISNKMKIRKKNCKNKENYEIKSSKKRI